jgi:uncharacterized protein (TIGR02466 family)
MNLKHLFPIPMLNTKIDDGIINNTLSLVNKFVEESKITENSSPGDLLTTYYHVKDFLGTIKDYELLDVITANSKTFMELLGYDKDYPIEINSWLNYNQPQSFFFRHDHYSALISGVLYLQTPEKCGDIVFHSPLEARRVHDTFFRHRLKVKVKENNYNFAEMRITPQKGVVLMFEPWLQHTVERNCSDDNRISISFNVLV